MFIFQYFSFDMFLRKSIQLIFIRYLFISLYPIRHDSTQIESFCTGVEQKSCQESKIKPAREGNSHPVKGQRCTRKWYRQTVECRNDLLEQWKKTSKCVALTLCQAQSEEVVRKAKKIHWVRSTSNLLIAEWGGCQNNKIRPASKWHSQTIEHNMRKLSGQRNKGSERGELTSYQTQNKGVAGSGNADRGWTSIPFCWENELP
jgi:hypothetical protein